MTNSANQCTRILPLDAARFLAAVGVVWIHTYQTPATAELANLGRFAVPFFTAAAGYLMVLSLQRKSNLNLYSFVASRLQRLYLPFLAWSCVYLVFRWAKAAMLGGGEPNLLSWDIFVLGGAYHLWFIPYLMLASIAAFLLIRLVGHNHLHQQRAAIACYALGLIIAIVISLSITLLSTESDHVLGFMAMATPAFLWGLALGWLQSANIARHDQPCFASSSITIVSSLVILFLAATTLTFTSGRSPLLENAAGSALLLVSIYAGLYFRANDSKTTTSESIRKLGQVSLGIYFSHLIFIKVAEVIAGKLNVTDNISTTTVLFAIVVLASTTFSLLAYRLKPTRWLVA